MVGAASGCFAEVFIHRHAGLEAPLLLLSFLFTLLPFHLTALLSSLSLVHVLLVIVGSGRIVFIDVLWPKARRGAHPGGHVLMMWLLIPTRLG